MHSNLHVYTTSGVWTKPPRLFAIELVIRSAGGGGSRISNTSGAGGGGGGAVRTLKRIPALSLPETVIVTVGPGGGPGQAGGASSFGDLLSVPGGGGAVGSIPGEGGYSSLRGGKGGATGQNGGWVGDMVTGLLAGGGGGGGAGGGGGPSGMSHVFHYVGVPNFWQWCQSGWGGIGGTATSASSSGCFPAGGGGGGGSVAGNGAAGCVSILEHILD
ncbi:hypothetical protein [Prescottella agglutinans]|uniref:Glycine-rich domain-containing protein n=1 Tax=Prescottella agglutinans TaxID=1644129 RepID=A0ABT6M4U2_9NOCA|nr:hypothetical protein [Prescottella agglutinans]MDH6279331.1 hypothetical protein [Prescottella agglutinans]